MSERTSALDVSRPRGLILNLDAQPEEAERVLKALASEPRLRILRLLSEHLLNVSQVARELDMPVSTANVHVNILEEAGLLLTETRPAARGLQKVCTRAFDNVLVQLPHDEEPDDRVMELSMPIGAFVDCDVAPSCGLAGPASIIGLFDDPASFYEPDRMDAQLLWFHHGHVEYRFPNRLPSTADLDSLSLSLELCSEAPLHHDNWPSDVTVGVNGVDVGTWTSPADFGGQRGTLTPAWWDSHNSQYGLLKVWRVDREGARVDGLKVSDVTLADLGLAERDFITIRIGVKPDARHVGGVNIFGRGFGNYPQDIFLRLRYR